jgi:hypothetical protein
MIPFPTLTTADGLGDTMEGDEQLWLRPNTRLAEPGYCPHLYVHALDTHTALR